PLVILSALEGQPLPVYGKGDQVRDWLYVDDHARALHTVLTCGVIGETYNIGGHNEKKNIDVVHALCALLDELRPTRRNPSTEHLSSYGELIRFVQDRPGHDRRYAIDASKIQHELGWIPHETFDTGLRKTVEWYLHNQEWVDHVKSGAHKACQENSDQ